MGNTFTNNTEWKFTLDHERPGQKLAIIAGNYLKGTVIVKVTRDLPPTKLLLQLKGEEKAKVIYSSGSHRKSMDNIYELCAETTVLREEGTTPILAGTHVFPFEILLLPGLPSTMQGKGGMGDPSHCSIYYRLVVDAQHNGKTISKVAQLFFNVASTPLPDDLVPTCVHPRVFNVESTFSRLGSMSIGARVVDARVGRGTDLMIYLACRNDATASIHRVEIHLIQNLAWWVGNRSVKDTRTIAEIPDVDLPGLVRGKIDKQQVKEIKLRGGVNSDELQELHNKLESNENMVTLKIPADCRDTYIGPLVRIKHFLKITIFTKSMVSNPSITIPLHIGFAPQVRRQQFPPELDPSSQQEYPMASAHPLPMEQPDQSPVHNLHDMTIPMAEAVLF